MLYSDEIATSSASTIDDLVWNKAPQTYEEMFWEEYQAEMEWNALWDSCLAL